MGYNTTFVDESKYDDSGDFTPIKGAEIGPTSSVQIYHDKVRNMVGIVETVGTKGEEK